MFILFSCSSKLLKPFSTLDSKKYAFAHKCMLNMEKAYLRQKDNDQYELTFKFVSEIPKVNRQFNFNRNLTESVDLLTSRVAHNVMNIIQKKNKKGKSELTEQIDYNVEVKILLNKAEVAKDKLCKDVFKPGNSIVLRIMDKEFDLIINSPWVHNLCLPISILAGFPTYPSKFETVFTNKKLSHFTWSKSIDEKEWTCVGNDYIYQPTNDDIKNYLKLTCVPKNEQSEGPPVECVSVCRVEASPGLCPFEVRHHFTKERTRKDELRVVTYNILADLYCSSDYARTVLHPYCPPYALEIDYRKQLFIKEIIGYNADIICLQEVDRKIFQYDLAPVFSHLGYGSTFFTKGDEVAEGLALIYHKSQLNLIESHRFVFSQHISEDKLFSEIWNKISQNENLANRILQRSTTLQVNLLELLNSEELLVVANTHLYFHPDADHIRLLHGGLAITYLEHYVNELKNKTSKRISLIFCGDFNSVPECGVFKLYTEGEVPHDFIDYQSNQDEVITNLELKQPFKLASACGTPRYTNYTEEFSGCLDYIFYEKDKLEVTHVVPLPTHEEVVLNTALPSVVFPSDHMALISDLRLL